MKINAASISFLFLANAITANSPAKSVSGQISENTTYQHFITGPGRGEGACCGET